MHSSAPKPGFSLIELLVVIAVIALLIGLLLPALATMRRNSRLTVCQANVRSQGALIAVYVSDFKELMPPRHAYITEPDPAGGYVIHDLLINGVLSRYNGESFREEPGAPWPLPTGAWRCPDVRDDGDLSRATHDGILHHAPNQWLFNHGIWNYQNGTMRIFTDIYPGWQQKFGNRWRRFGDSQDPRQTISIMCNVNYYVPSHGHSDARAYYGLALEAVKGQTEAGFDNKGSHDELGVRPAVFLDGHGEAVPSGTDSWLERQSTFNAPDGTVASLYDAEVQKFMWFVAPNERSHGK